MPPFPQSDILPSSKAIRNRLSYTIFDSKSQALALTAALPSTPRVLVIFIRHFLCGNCQQFLLTLTSLLPPSSLPKDLSIVVIGCGAPSHIQSYVEITQCPYPIYADPSAKLYEVLGMHRSLSLGHRNPEYIQHSLVVGAVKSIVQSIKRVSSGNWDVWQAGDMSLNGGEFLFVRDSESGNGEGGEGRLGWKVEWCHRMRNTRDHTEVEDLKIVLGLSEAKDVEGEDEKEKDIQPLMRRATTSKMHRGLSRSQSWVHGLTRSQTISRPTGRMKRFHSHSASVQVVSAS